MKNAYKSLRWPAALVTVFALSEAFIALDLLPVVEASAELTEQETRRAKDEPRETRWDDDVAGLLVDYQRGIRDLERQLSSSTDTESLTPHFAY